MATDYKKRLDELVPRLRRYLHDPHDGWTQDSSGWTELGELEEIARALLKERDELRKSVDTLFHFVPKWAESVPDGLDPTFYGTGTADGDRRVKARVDDIRDFMKDI